MITRGVLQAAVGQGMQALGEAALMGSCNSKGVGAPAVILEVASHNGVVDVALWAVCVIEHGTDTTLGPPCTAF